MTTTIAVLGTGAMGNPMARRLLATGHRLRVWNRSADRTAEVVAAGAVAAVTPAAAVASADAVITMLADAGAVESVLFGPDGAAAAMRPGSVLLQTATIGPDAMRELAQRMPAGVLVVDAPVGGSVGAALAGELTVLAGGEDGALTAATPVLAMLGRIRRCGPVGAASAMKLVLIGSMITAMAALHDVLTVADAVGIDRADALDVLADSVLAGAVQRATKSGSAFAIAMAGKDIDLARAVAGDRPLPVADAAAAWLRSAPDPTADVAVLITGRDITGADGTHS